MSDQISVRGARQHNLKNVSVDIPRNKLTVITGQSGSGKSSLAFDTIYAEGQRRYVESLSAYARQFLEQSQKPDVDSIEGLSPAISIEQKTTSKNPRSTVGTVTEVYDYLRLLYARVGHPHCPNCNIPIRGQTVQQMADHVLALGNGTKLNVMGPIARQRKGEYKKELLQLRKDGYSRVDVDGETFELGDDITLDKNKKHDIDVYIDRLVLKDGIKQRLTDSIESALRLAGGIVKFSVVGSDGKVSKTWDASEKYACKNCGFTFPELEPRLFSFNNPSGACPTCTGLGERTFFDERLIIPNPDISIDDGAIAPFHQRGNYYSALVGSVLKHYKAKSNVPWKKLPNPVREAILRGSGEEEISFRFESEENKWHFKKPYEGVLPTLERRFRETESESSREEYEKYLSRRACETCGGARLKREALAVKVGESTIQQVSALTLLQAEKFFSTLELEGREQAIAAKILKEIRDRLGFLVAVGLDYLSLDRTSGTLSGGESQRIRLATQIGSALMGVLYVLDEPSIGLHQRDNDKLLDMLRRLRDLGNTVLVVEHDEDTILTADYVIDMGPGAGTLGGTVVTAGTPDDVTNNKHSVTGQFLLGERFIEWPEERRKGSGKYITIKNASGNNLRKVSTKIPLGTLTCVTGVSGSGKSTLVLDTLYRAMAEKFHLSAPKPEAHDAITGTEGIEGVIDIDQSPIGRTPRSNPATYTGLFGPLRELFAALPESKARGYGPGRFSFNVKGGRCEACEGDGVIRIDMQFLADLYVTCETCRGRRYNRETLEVLWKGKNIADILEMNVDEACVFLQPVPSISRKLDVLRDVGLGYVALGQAATTLSGGEAQRIKLAKELSRKAAGPTLYILDEPTTGLHFADVEKLLFVLQRLIDAGHTIVCIEHNLDVIKCADWLIDMGPEGGAGGGQVIAEGTPEQVALVKESFTGQFLAKKKALDEARAKRRVKKSA